MLTVLLPLQLYRFLHYLLPPICPYSITFHKAVGWSIAFFSLLHTAAHMRNFYLLASSMRTGFVGFLLANFATGPGVTGWLMSLILGVMIWFAMEKRRRKNFERFWYSHHLFVLFFALWQLHVRSSFAYRQLLMLFGRPGHVLHDQARQAALLRRLADRGILEVLPRRRADLRE